MTTWQIILAATSAVILFLFGIENFSKEMQKISGEKFRNFLSKHTHNPIKGTLLGGLVTALIQSSTATSVIAVGLVNAGIISFKNSMGIIFGSNIGTTITAQLVAFKLTDIAPYFIIIGFITSLLRIKYSFIGKSIFFFGFVFFSLNIVSGSIAPLKDNPELLSWFLNIDNFFFRVIAGTIFTSIVQSSSVTTGIAVIFVQQGFLPLDHAIPIVMGANIGTTITAFLASINMDNPAKKTALLNIFYNIGGVLLFSPIIFFKSDLFAGIGSTSAEALANFHFIFNVVTTTVFLIFLKPLNALFSHVYKDSEELEIKYPDFPKSFTEEEIPNLVSEIEKTLDELLIKLKENYFTVSISIEAKEEHLLNKCKKYHSYMLYIKSEITSFCAKISKVNSDAVISKRIIDVVSKIDYLFQINDSLQNLIEINEEIIQKRIVLSLETIMSIREVSTAIVGLFDAIISMKGEKKINFKEAHSEALHSLSKSYQVLLKEMNRVDNEDATPLARFLSINQRLKDKLHSLNHL